MFYMTEDMSFKCLIFLNVLPRDLFRNPTKSLWWSIFAKIFKDFKSLTIFAKKPHHRYLTGF